MTGLLKGQVRVLNALGLYPEYSEGARTVAMLAPSRYGKTSLQFIAGNLAADRWFQNHNEQFQWTWWEPTHKMFLQNLVPEYIGNNESRIKRFLRRLIPGRLNKHDGVYTSFDESIIIRFFTGEVPERGEGNTAHFTSYNEAGQTPKKCADVVFSRMLLAGMGAGQTFISTTPYNMGWLFDFCITDAAKNGVKVVDKLSLLENPKKYTQAVIDEARRTLPRHIFEMRFMGRFARAEGLVFPYEESNIVDPDVFDRGDMIRFWAGMDFGWSDPVAIALFCELKGGRTLLVDEIYRTELPSGGIYQQIDLMCRRWGLRTNSLSIHADPAQWTIGEELRKTYGLNMFPAKKGPGSLDAGILKVNSMLLDKTLLVSKDCEYWIMEANQYCYNDRGVPIDKYNHLMDATRYGLAPSVTVPSVEATETHGSRGIDFGGFGG